MKPVTLSYTNPVLHPANGNTDGRVGTYRSLLREVKGDINVPELLFLMSDPTVSYQQLHKVQYPRDLVSWPCAELGLEFFLHRCGPHALVEEVQFFQYQEVEGIGQPIGIL